MGSKHISMTKIVLVLVLLGAVYAVGTFVKPKPPAPPPPPPKETPEQVAARTKEYWKQYRQMMMQKEGPLDRIAQRKIAEEKQLTRTAKGRKILAARKHQEATIRQVEINRSGYFLENPMGVAGEQKARKEQKKLP